MLPLSLLSSPLAASVAGLAVTLSLSFPHLRQLLPTHKGKTAYFALRRETEDEEIITSEAPNTAWQRLILLSVSSLATVGAFISAVASVNARTTSMSILILAEWVLVLLQEFILVSQYWSEDQYRLGCYSALSALAVGSSTGMKLSESLLSRQDALNAGVKLEILQPIAALILVVVNLALPKGPRVYRNGRLVDEQNSVSFLNRYTFSWARQTLSLAAKKGQLSPEDLPLVEDDVRAKALFDSFSQASTTGLWRKWLQIYWPTITFQVCIQLIANVLNFLPNLLFLTILRLLEERDAGQNNKLQMLLVALELGLSMMVVSWLKSLRESIGILNLSLPIHEQLFAVVTSKLFNLKNIVSLASDGEGEDSRDSDDKKPLQTTHSILNLLGVDVESISTFFAYSHLVLDCIFEVTITIIFLVYLIGWKPTLAGCAIPILMIPVDYNLTKQYSETEQELMDRRDEKSAVLVEMVRGMRQVKFSALEGEWNKKILKLRDNELQHQRAVFRCYIWLRGLWQAGPIFTSIFSLVTYIHINGTISPSVAFTALGIFRGLENVLGNLPEILTDLLDASVSVKRVERFLDLEEHQNSTVSGDSISIQRATIAWPSTGYRDVECPFHLRDIQLNFPTGGLTVISGQSGSGKSLLLTTLIGEAEVINGAVVVPRALCPSHDALNCENRVINGQIAYVSQDPWIENATIRDAILFGLPFNKSRYNEVLDACALSHDLTNFESGDMTDIGTNGINLSGGQRWRLAFGRALYSRAQILILDDIFSAVDSHVGKHLYEKALMGNLSTGRTRILATHHTRLCLEGAAYWVRLEKGKVLYAGPPETGIDNSLSKTTTTLDDNMSQIRNENSNIRDQFPKAREQQRPSLSDDITIAKKFYAEEKRERGGVKLEVYKAYVKAGGGYIHWILLISCLFLTLLLYLAPSYWVSLWTRVYDDNPRPNISVAGTSGWLHVDARLLHYGAVYMGISVCSWLVDITLHQLVFLGSLRASKAVFERFTENILYAPLHFLDTTPVGQILNRFTSDFGVLDSDLAMNISCLMRSVVLILGVIIATLVTSPLVVVLSVVALITSWGVAYFYVTGAREAKRLESTAKSPIFELVGSLLTGLPTIRAFGKEQVYLKRMYSLIDAHCQALWHRHLFACWMEFWLEIVGASFVASVAIVFVNIPSIDAPLAGFALSFALNMSDLISWMLTQYTQLDLGFNAAERIVEYMRLDRESQAGIQVPVSWPTKGEIDVQGLYISYAADLPTILNGLGFSVRPGERIGIVGRTGAGKSSLGIALLRCLETRSGSIYIDGVDISHVRLKDLRSRIGIISQDPIVFSGTVREVLDPFEQYGDRELQDALEKVSLLPPPMTGSNSACEDILSQEVNQIFSLSFAIAEGGKNLSQGQRQLLCLARALVSHPRILIMDEATASIDMGSDRCIQRALREEVQDSTLLVIAHRLSTIADFDRVLVMEGGRIVEMDRPSVLMKKANGVFRGLVESSGEREAIERMIFGGADGVQYELL